MTHKLFCLMGESGSGKTTIADELEKLGLKVVQSYTTRPQRYEGERGHIFVSDSEYEQFKANNDITAYSLFNGYHYFCTFEQVNTHDIYVVDPDGIKDLKEKSPHLDIKVIYIDVDEQTRISRMLERGDGIGQVSNRLYNDKIKFNEKEYDFRVVNADLIQSVQDIVFYITTNKILG